MTLHCLQTSVIQLHVLSVRWVCMYCLLYIASKLKLSQHYCIYAAVLYNLLLYRSFFKLVVFYGQGFAVPPFTIALFGLCIHTPPGSAIDRSVVRYFTTICELSAVNGKHFTLFSQQESSRNVFYC